MPFYNYKCTDCEYEMKNQLRPFSAKVIKCDRCNKETAEQQFSGMFAAHGLPNGHNAVRAKK